MIDIIILSNGRTPELVDMTQECIDSCHDSESEHEFNILVFEQAKGIEYVGANTINYSCDFHYNKLMNLGIQLTNADWICLCNNDLIFHEGWLTECLKHDYLSMSPNDKTDGSGVDEGYAVGQKGQMKGQCILTNRKLYEQIGKIDESVNFHYSDHVMADQMEEAGVKHALIKGAYVEHLESVTLKTLDEAGRKKYCDDQNEIYYKEKPNIEIK